MRFLAAPHARRAYLTHALAVGAIAATLLPACTTRCRGPGCEDDFSSTHVARLPGSALLQGEVELDELDAPTLVGTAEDGPSWSLDVAGVDWLIGQPGPELVVRVSPPIDDAAVEPIATWFVPDAEGFGRRVVVVPTAAGFDLWVASPDADGDRGAVWRFSDAHDTSGLGPEPDLVVRSSFPGDRLGERLVRCGDLTGDRRPDLAVSIPWLQPPDGWTVADPSEVPAVSGAVAILRSEAMDSLSGEARPWDIGPLYWGPSVGAAAGKGIDCSSDLDGDGRVDLVIGAPHAADQAGEVYVVTQPLPDSGPLPEVAWRTLSSPAPGAWFGEEVHAATFADAVSLFVGAPGWDGGRGAVYLYRSLDDEAPRAVAAYDNERGTPDHLGRTIATGDLDGDGRAELLLGAPDYRIDNRTYGVGRLWVFGPDQPFGAPLSDALGELTDTQPFRRIGADVLTVDLDGDGADEVSLPTRRP